MIKTRDLVKRYGRVTAVDRVSLEVRAGEVYGFLGPNGAGKTSTIRMLLGTIRPTSGEMTLFGEQYTHRRLDLRRRIGVVPELHPVGAWRWMTAREYLRFFADLYDLRGAEARIRELLGRVELGEVGGRRIATFSRGMLQKLSFARAILHDPELLILDEPISGLDPIGIKQVRDLIVEQNRAGKTVLISSHQLSEIEKICRRVGVISQGRLVAQSTMDSLLSSLTSEVEIRVELDGVDAELLAAARQLGFVRGVSADGAVLMVRVGRDRDYRKDLGEFLIRRGRVPLGMRVEEPTLEDAFVTITKQNAGTPAEGSR